MNSYENIGARAKIASKQIALLDDEKINEILTQIAKCFIENKENIIRENKKDVDKAKADGLRENLIDRLILNDDRIESMSNGAKKLSKLKSPCNEIIDEFETVDGLKIQKVTVPFGVIAVIFESRPNVNADAACLALKSKNAIVLKGGSDAKNTNAYLCKLMRETLMNLDLNPDAICLFDDYKRENLSVLLNQSQTIDLVIPRGGAGLIQKVKKISKIPVIETGVGNCTIYVDEFADLDKAIDIIDNAKTQRSSVCNAAEGMLIHQNIAKEALVPICNRLLNKGVEIRACEKSRLIMPELKPATEEDYKTEFLSNIISCKIVEDIDEAILYLDKYSTHHSDAIITTNENNAEKFLSEVDSACVYVNSSTRFTDGGCFGFGAEIGISTQKLHARGPMGLRELQTYKYKIKGNYQIRE
ncbi:MAG: glutamate-5-semialdehyde dehydrogenase [Clostridia bacterium]|nr:glutamate-5-semialdehyde dehydrogenase [Clostridia bacterium]